jgi:hypothetical protein
MRLRRKTDEHDWQGELAALASASITDRSGRERGPTRRTKVVRLLYLVAALALALFVPAAIVLKLADPHPGGFARVFGSIAVVVFFLSAVDSVIRRIAKRRKRGFEDSRNGSSPFLTQLQLSSTNSWSSRRIAAATSDGYGRGKTVWLAYGRSLLTCGRSLT